MVNKKYVPLLSLMILSSSMDLNAQDYTQTQLGGAGAALIATAAAIWYACQPNTYEDILKKEGQKLTAISQHFYMSRDKLGHILECLEHINPLEEEDLWAEGLMDGDIDQLPKNLFRDNEALRYPFSSSLPAEADLNLIYLLLIERRSLTQRKEALRISLKEITAIAKKLERTIPYEKNSASKSPLKETELESFLDLMFELKVGELQFLFLQDCFTYHKTYFELQDLTKKLSREYSQELRALTYSHEHVRSFYSLKRGNQLAADLKKLQNLLSDATSRDYPNLRDKAECLSYDLSCICNHMLNDPRYALDLYNEQPAEQLRLERLRNQMLRNQLYCNQKPTQVYVNVQYTTPTAPAKKNKQQETPATPMPAINTKSEKPATLEPSTTSIFDYSHGAADL